jgi:hypothetical protein
VANPKIFISFAAEDIRARDFLVAQAKNHRTPFTFRDMSLGQPFDERWKTQCREKISECHGFIALLSKRTWRAAGARWEMLCAAQEGIPSLGIHIHKDEQGAKPPELKGRVVEWRWQTIANFIERVDSRRGFWDKFWD